MLMIHISGSEQRREFCLWYQVKSTDPFRIQYQVQDTCIQAKKSTVDINQVMFLAYLTLPKQPGNTLARAPGGGQ